MEVNNGLKSDNIEEKIDKTVIHAEGVFYNKSLLLLGLPFYQIFSFSLSLYIYIRNK